MWVLLNAQYTNCPVHSFMQPCACYYFTLFTHVLLLFFRFFIKKTQSLWLNLSPFAVHRVSPNIQRVVHLNINYDKLIRRAWRWYFCAHVEQSYLNEKQII